MTDKKLEPAQRAAQMLGGVAHAPRLVNVRTRSDEIIKPAPTENNRIVFEYLEPYAMTSSEVSIWIREGLPPDSLAPAVVSRKYLERHQWATSIWIPESETYDPETNTLTLRGYYRVYLFDVWGEPGEHSADSESAEEDSQP